VKKNQATEPADLYIVGPRGVFGPATHGVCDAAKLRMGAYTMQTGTICDVDVLSPDQLSRARPIAECFDGRWRE
jgi:hypothetical protein